MSDLRYAFRQFAKSPGFTLVAILTLALGIGACTAIFSVVNSVLLRPVAYPDSDRVVILRESSPQYPDFPVAPANYLDWTNEIGPIFESMYAAYEDNFNLSGSGEPVHVTGLRASGRYFDVLRSRPMLGRVFGSDDEVSGRGRLAVLSHGCWQQRFGGNPNIVGKIIYLHGWPIEVIGVMPPTFQPDGQIEVFTPMILPDDQRQNRRSHYLSVGARLKPGATVEQARTVMDTIAARLARRYPDTNNNWDITVTPLLENVTGSLRSTLYTLLAAVAVLLLIACANVASLLLARATSRQREISLRAALGASRWRVIRQLLTESMVLALAGGALGVLLGHWALDALLAFVPATLPRVGEIALDHRVLATTLVVTILSGLGFGLVPALQASRIDLVDALKEGARGASDGRHRHLIRHGLVVAQIALALVLLTIAGLLIRSFIKLASFDPGFDPQGAMFVEVQVPFRKYGAPDKQVTFVDAVIERYRALPGVSSVAATHALPLAAESVLGLEIEGRDSRPTDLPSTNYYAITPDYFKAAGIPLLRGRMFTAQDRTETTPVAIISQSAAETFFRGEDPLGKRIHPSEDKEGARVWREIVGIVADVKHYGARRDSAPQTYTAFAQSPSRVMTFLVRTASDPKKIRSFDPASLAGALRRELLAVDPEQPPTRVEPLTHLLTVAIARERFAMTIFTAFSGVALLLVSAGVYSVMAYAVSQRTGEFGIRLALGAQPSDILKLILSHGARLVMIGVLGGVLGALAAARFVQSLLYQTPARDPLVIAAIASLLGAVVLIACWIPARRATKVDPMIAVRAE